MYVSTRDCAINMCDSLSILCDISIYDCKKQKKTFKSKSCDRCWEKIVFLFNKTQLLKPECSPYFKLVSRALSFNHRIPNTKVADVVLWSTTSLTDFLKRAHLSGKEALIPSWPPRLDGAQWLHSITVSLVFTTCHLSQVISKIFFYTNPSILNLTSTPEYWYFYSRLYFHNRRSEKC